MVSLTEQPPLRRRPVVLALGLGAILILGGQRRVSGPSYTVVHDIGGPYGWGIAFVLLGVLMLIGGGARWPRTTPMAYRLAAAGYFLFAWACVGAAIESDVAGLTGIVTYTWVSWLHMSAAQHAREQLPPSRIAQRVARFARLAARKVRPHEH